MKTSFALIQDLMLRDGLTKKDLAKIAGVGPSAVTKWASGGAIRMGTLCRIADYFHVPPMSLYPQREGLETSPTVYENEIDMQTNFDQLLSRIQTLPGIENVSGFARSIGMNQKTVDLYLKGERKPSLEFVLSICSRLAVSADWLLGLSDTKTIQQGRTSDPVQQAKLEGLKAAIRSLLDQY